MKRRIVAIDLFCGVGGLSYGLQKAGLPVRSGIDLDESCRFAFEKNIRSKFLHTDLAKLKPEVLQDLYPKGCVRVLTGCAPCQPFSSHTNKLQDRSADAKWQLLDHFGRLARSVLPDIISMENVPELAKTTIFTKFLRTLKASGYFVSWEIVQCASYGVPQKRKRLVLLASQAGPIALLPPTHPPDRFRTVGDTIRKIKPSANDPLNISSVLSSTNMARIKHSRPGGTWRDWPARLRLPCHSRISGKSYPGVYGRMRWDQPAPTITTQFHVYGTGRFGHPVYNRALTLREGAMLQTFPRNFVFAKSGTEVLVTRIARHIGNAVPVRLGTVIGQSILDHAKAEFP